MRAACLALCLVALQGCAAAALSVVGIAGGAGFDHVVNGVVYQTVSAPIAGTRLATLKALRRMGMAVEKDHQIKDGWALVARAKERKIEIELERVADSSARMRVDVYRENFAFYKDPSVGREIINQTEAELPRLKPKNVRIATVQMLLGELGYHKSKPDGIMGRKTRKSIVRFQKNYTKRPDGKVSGRLVAKLKKKRDAVRAAAEKARNNQPH